MSNLDSFHEVLATLYQESLNIKLSVSDSISDDTPIWQRVSINNFLQKDGDIGLLLDPEIGLAMFVLEYQQGDDLCEEIRQALRFSDKLQPAYQQKISDMNGTWQVGLLWLVHGEELAKDWKSAIAERRKQSGFSEEIALDAIFYDSLVGIKESIMKREGLHQLLLQTRKLFRMDIKSMYSWHSANSKVAEMLRSFPQQFKNIAEIEIANRIVEQSLSQNISFSEEEYPNLPKSVLQLEVRNFRNIELCKLQLRSALEKHPVIPKVIFGPNGTGKTALFEALSLALCGSSKKLCDYLEDKDSSTNKPYIENVLHPLKNGVANPEVSTDNILWSTLANNLESAKKQLQSMEGTILEQEESRMFAYADKNELASKVLSGYSTLAEYVQRKTDEGFQQEHVRRQKLLMEYGLNQSIRKIETLRERVVEKVLGKELSPPSPSFLAWLSRISNLLPDDRRFHNVFTRWKYWSDENLKEFFSEFISSGDPKALNNLLMERIKSRQLLIVDNQILLDELRLQTSNLWKDIDRVMSDLDIWAAWLDQKTITKPTPDANREFAELKSTLANLQTESQKLTAQGTLLRSRQEHLQQTAQFLKAWAPEHPAECPTCNADHKSHGGILVVTKKLQETNNEQLEELRKKYSNLKNSIKDTETRIAVLGQLSCPLSIERREEISELLSVITLPEDIESWLKHPDKKQRLISILQSLQVLPPLPTLLSDESIQSERITQDIMTRLTEADRVWAAPEHWDVVKKKLGQACVEILQSHMPKTLQAVWSELLFTLTPARWNLAAEPKIDFKLSRGNNEMRILTEKNERKILARYLFNQAEIHLLGLAWFFMRYFSSGRFRHALIAMDDPAQEMDQTTYRTFTRFLQTLTRLHRYHNRTLSIMLFLHQEDRALDAARAMEATLEVLGWEKEFSSENNFNHVLSELKLVSEQFKPINAIRLFQDSSVSSER